MQHNGDGEGISLSLSPPPSLSLSFSIWKWKWCGGKKVSQVEIRVHSFVSTESTAHEKKYDVAPVCALRSVFSIKRLLGR